MSLIIKNPDGYDVKRIKDEEGIKHVCDIIAKKTEICIVPNNVKETFEVLQFCGLPRICGFSGNIPKEVYVIENSEIIMYVIPDVIIENIKKISEIYTYDSCIELLEGNGFLVYMEMGYEDQNSLCYYPPSWNGEDDYGEGIKFIKEGNKGILVLQ